MQVVVARPRDLDRLPVHRLGQRRRLDGVVGLRLPAEAAAEQRDVHGHVLDRDADALRDQVAGGLRRLEAAPDLALPVRDPRRRGRRLHGRVREMRDVVLRLDALCSLRHGGRVVAVVAHHLPGLAHGSLELLPEGDRVVAGVRSVVPHDLQRLAALHRSPGVPRDDGDAAERIELGRRGARLDLDHAHHAGHLERFGGVVALDLAAVHRRTRDDGIEHAVEPRVDAVPGLAGRDVPRVDRLELALADVAELRRVLELDRIPGGHRLRGGRFCQRAIPETAPGRNVHHLVVLGLHFADRHLPALGGGRFEHLARGGAAAAHRIEEVARAARAVGVLVAVALLVAGRLHHAHALPVGFELVGDDHRHAGANALAHLGAVADDADDAVRGDRDEHQRVVGPAVRHAVRAVLRRIGRARGGREAGREHETAQRGRFLQETAAADVGEHQGPLERRHRPSSDREPDCRVARS